MQRFRFIAKGIDMITLHQTTRHMPRKAASLPLLNHITQFPALWRQRRALRALDARQLCDLGLTRAQADAEAARPVWDVPATWRS